MFRLYLLLCAAIGVLADAPTEKCKAVDGACLSRLAKNLYSKFFDEALGLDPMHLDVIEGNLSILKYKFMDTTVKGYKDCDVESANAEFDKLKMEIVLLCPRLLLTGKYELKGRLNILPIKGSGTFIIDAFKYRFKINMNIELQANGGKTNLNIKNYVAEAKPLQGIKFTFDNLFNGNKALSEPVHKYANENWKEVAKSFQGPIINAELNKIVEVTNKQLKKLAFQDYITL